METKAITDAEEKTANAMTEETYSMVPSVTTYSTVAEWRENDINNFPSSKFTDKQIPQNTESTIRVASSKDGIITRGFAIINQPNSQETTDNFIATTSAMISKSVSFL